jgi:hypothetical protein
MTNFRIWRCWPLLPGLLIGGVEAAPIEGEVSSNAAALLVLLGIWALLMGVRNLRGIRHKRLTPGHQIPPDETEDRHSH